jgi:hypothetical protein
MLVAFLGAAAAAPARDTPSHGMPPRRIVGVGETPDQAERGAIESATNVIKDYLRDSHPDLLGMFPDRYLLKSKMIDRRGPAKQTTLPNGQPGYQVEYVAGALRLDTASRGYYSGRLFVITTALVAAIGWTAWQWL